MTKNIIGLKGSSNYDERKSSTEILPGTNIRILPDGTLDTSIVITSPLIVLEDGLQGRDTKTAYADGDLVSYTIPRRGDVVRVLLLDGEVVIDGDGLEANANGKFIKCDSDCSFFRVMESASPVGTDQLITVRTINPSSAPPMPVMAGMYQWMDMSVKESLYANHGGGPVPIVDGDLIFRIEDQSGNGRHMEQPNSVNRPQYIETTSPVGPASLFATTDILAIPAEDGPDSDWTVYMVLDPTILFNFNLPMVIGNAALPNFLILGLAGSGADNNTYYFNNGTNFPKTATPDRPQVITYAMANSFGKIYRDRVLQGSPTAYLPVSDSAWGFGNLPGNAFGLNGYMYEVLAYKNVDHTSEEQTQNWDYLENKWTGVAFP